MKYAPAGHLRQGRTYVSMKKLYGKNSDEENDEEEENEEDENGIE